MHLVSTINKLIQTIEAHEKIAIFRHVNPDGDALGSQYAVYNFIKENYPDKEVYILGERNDDLEFFTKENQVVSEDFLKDAYALVFDTANKVRIDGPYILCKGMLNVDHHPNDAPYGDEYIVDSSRSSTCEIVAELLVETNKVSKTTASYLLAGILTDTIRFSISNTKSATLRVAATLMECGADITALTKEFFTKRYVDFDFERIFAKHVTFEDGLATLIITKEMRDQYNLSDRDAKQYGSVMRNVKDFKITAVFTETDEGAYIGSLRSQNITVNTIAEKYHGGGHRLAAGFKACDTFELNQMQKELLELVRSE